MYPLFYIWYKGKNVNKLMEFKSALEHITEEQYVEFYRLYNSLADRKTDLNQASIEFIFKHIGEDKNKKIIDIGCGNGYLLSLLKQKGYTNLTGSDIINKMDDPSINFIQGNIQSLPILDQEYDVVLCNHTIEHVLDVQRTVDELKRITKNKLILTTPCQKYNKYTFDLHVNFYPQKRDLINLFSDKEYHCEKNNGDWSLVVKINL